MAACYAPTTTSIPSHPFHSLSTRTRMDRSDGRRSSSACFCSLTLPLLFCPGHFRTLDSTNETDILLRCRDSRKTRTESLIAASQSLRILLPRHHTLVSSSSFLPPHFLPLHDHHEHGEARKTAPTNSSVLLRTVTTTLLFTTQCGEDAERKHTEDRKLNSARSGHTELGPSTDILRP